MKTDFIHLSPTKKAAEFSISKADRGLLTDKRKISPGPGNYENGPQAIGTRLKEATFALPRATRDVSFSKYSAEHSILISKGLH